MITLESYDQIPYDDCPIVESLPDHIHTLARLFGLSPAAADTARVLELGCASGGNLIPMAYHWPNAEFIGIELSQHQAREGQQIIEELGLGNIQIIQDDLCNFFNTDQDTLGSFDYIIAHGVYSWVPNRVRNAIIEICHNRLNPNGIAYISFNARPGWDLRRMLSDMLQYHNRNTTAEGDKITQARNLLQAFVDGLPDNSSLSESWLKHEAAELLAKPASYLLHDYLERHNHPVYFHEFNDHIEQHDLHYFTDANLYTVLGSTLTHSAQAFLDLMETPLDYEQYLDFFYLKHFRQALICHKDQDFSRELDIEQLQQAYFFTMLQTQNEIDLKNKSDQTFTNPLGDAYVANHPLTKAAMVTLSNHYPAMLSFDNVYMEAAKLLYEQGDPLYIDDKEGFFLELAQLILSGAVRASFHFRDVATEEVIKGEASKLAVTMASHHKCCTASVHHNSVRLDSIDAFVITRLDGKQSLQSIAKELLDSLKTQPMLRAEVYVMIGEPATDTAIENYIQELIYYWRGLGIVS